VGQGQKTPSLLSPNVEEIFLPRLANIGKLTKLIIIINIINVPSANLCHERTCSDSSRSASIRRTKRRVELVDEHVAIVLLQQV